MHKGVYGQQQYGAVQHRAVLPACHPQIAPSQQPARQASQHSAYAVHSRHHTASAPQGHISLQAASALGMCCITACRYAGCLKLVVHRLHDCVMYTTFLLTALAMHCTRLHSVCTEHSDSCCMLPCLCAVKTLHVLSDRLTNLLASSTLALHVHMQLSPLCGHAMLACAVAPCCFLTAAAVICRATASASSSAALPAAANSPNAASAASLPASRLFRNLQHCTRTARTGRATAS